MLFDDPIHAVITWVDGSNPKYEAIRDQFQEEVERSEPLSENATNPHRWAHNDELFYCLSSIHNHAPWIDVIWIVTNGQKPSIKNLPDALTEKIKFVFHDELFAGLVDVLPTFNSLAIESLLWKIDGLSERFVYFNDDVFLTSPIEPEDLFLDNNVVLRGGWRDFSAMISDSEQYHQPAFFNHYLQINAAAMLDYKAEHLFSTAHVAHPMRRSMFQKLYTEHEADFLRNASFRFRDISQFLPQGLHNHACIKYGLAALKSRKDHFHIYSHFGEDLHASEVQRLLDQGIKNTKFMCINDLPALEDKLPDIRQWLMRVIDKSSSALAYSRR
ncbi:MAG: hypothetical protein U5K75_05970 [Ahrensia sp.]|nr:hypothetical protein [Ahrensia sp.]